MDTDTDVDTGAAGPAEGVRTAERLLVEVREEIGRADTKASVLVAAMGMSTGALIGLMTGQNAWGPGQLAGLTVAAWWTGWAAWTAALVCLLLAILPRYPRGARTPGGTVTYFQDIRLAAAAGDLAGALRRTERDPLAALVESLGENSRIVAVKHRWIRAGLAFFGAGALALSAAGIGG